MEIEIEEYLRIVATKVREARKKSNWTEIDRLLRTCAKTLLIKAKETKTCQQEKK